MRAIAIWICCCAYLNCIGWILSAIHELNTIGYAVALLFGLIALTIWRKKTSKEFLPHIFWGKLFRRFKRVFPLLFLIVATLEFIGGTIYPPNNYDALTYRLPRMLNWLSVDHWFWIPTVNERMNYSTTAWEWIAMPFFALLHSDRGLFLINALGFLLMPGLTFGALQRLGVARRVAWMWMWVLPLIYGCVMQAGSVGNDLVGVIFALASIYFGLRSRTSEKISDLWLAILAAALMTNTKLSNLPLLLPCFVAVLPTLIKLRVRWVANLAIACVAVLISAAPIIVLNQIHTGAWTGDPKNKSQIDVKNPVAGLLGNSLLLSQQCLMPPVLPRAHKANEWFDKLCPASTKQFLAENFPRYSSTFNELPQEETSGIGIGITLLLLAAIVAITFQRGRKLQNAPSQIWPMHLTAWIATLFFMMKMGSEADARLMLPYYPLIIATFLLLPSQRWLLQFRAWKIFATVMALSILPGVILSPSRPLWPASRISESLAQHYPQSPIVSRMVAVYSTYAHRNDLFAALRAKIPDNIHKVGFIAGSNDSDYSFWKPFGRRQVVYLQNEIQSNTDLPADVKWIAIKQNTWSTYSKIPMEQWAANHDAQIIASVSVTILVGWGEETWYLLHIQK